MKTKSKGVALVTVVLIFFVLVILLAGVMNATVVNQQSSQTTNDHTAVYYSAESALQVQIASIQELVDHTRNLDPGYTMANFPGNLANLVNTINGSTMTLNHLGETVDITLEAFPDPMAPDYTVISTATLSDVTRTLEFHFRFAVVEGDMDLGRAIIAQSSINTENNSTITGPVASLMSPTSSTIEITNCGVTKLYVPIGYDSDNVSIPNCLPAIEIIEGSLSSFPSVTVPVYPTVTANYRSVTIPASGTLNLPALTSPYIGYRASSFNPSGNLTINLGSGSPDRVLTLWITTALGTSMNSGNLTITGDGKLKVLTTLNRNTFTWNKYVNVGGSDPTKFMWYIRSTGTYNPTLTMPNNTIFVGSIYGNNVDFEIKKVNFTGFFVTGGDSIFTGANSSTDPNSRIWIYAPRATATIKANSTLYGSIMSNTISLESGGGIIYKGLDFDLPFSEVDLPLVPQASDIEGEYGNIIEQ